MEKKTTEYYLKILGVTVKSTKEEIKTAYRIAIKQCHPDKFPDDKQKILAATEKSKLINEAYQALKNYSPPIPKKSKSYYEHIYWHYKDRGNRNITRRNIDNVVVHSAGYDQKEKMLQIVFFESLYEYYGVPEDVFDKLIISEKPYNYYIEYIEWNYPGGQVGKVSKREVPHSN